MLRPSNVGRLPVWMGEVLQRQGWWVRKFETERDAANWVTNTAIDAGETVNPVTECRVRPSEPLHGHRPPRPPDITFDEWWPPPNG